MSSSSRSVPRRAFLASLAGGLASTAFALRAGRAAAGDSAGSAAGSPATRDSARAATSPSATSPSATSPSATSPSDAVTLEQALAEVARARAQLTSLEGPFTQERTIGLLRTKVTSTGTLTLVTPDRLRWELAPPDDVVYWVGPEGLAYRSRSGSAHVQANAARLGAALDDLRTVIGGDLGKLRARYDVSLAPNQPGDTYAFDARPKVKDGAPAQRITFALAADKVSPRRIEIIEGERDRTRIDFGPLRRDGAVDPARMRPPAP